MGHEVPPLPPAVIPSGDRRAPEETLLPNTVTPDGYRMHYERMGSGTAVVLIPGLGGNGRFWAGIVARLANRFDLATVDHRGAGRGDRAAGSYAIDRIARDVLAVMNAKGIEAAHLVGHSTGRVVVHTIALGAPRRARSLVISGSWDRPESRFRATSEARTTLLDAGLV